MKFGFTRIAVATPPVTVADCKSNSKEIISIIKEVATKGVEAVLFPELCITSCSCGDLYTQPYLLKKAEESLQEIIEASKKVETIIITGMPVSHINSLYNCAVVIYKGIIMGINAKNYPQKDELRWFTRGQELPYNEKTTLCGQETIIGCNIVYQTSSYSFGIEIGCDHFAPYAPGANAAIAGADIIFNPSAIGEEAGLWEKTKTSLIAESRRYICAYAHTNAGYGESTSNAVYSGYNAIIEKGTLLAEGKRFAKKRGYSISEVDIEKIGKERRDSTFFTPCNSNCQIVRIAQASSDSCEITRTFDPAPFIPDKDCADRRYEEIFMIQAQSLAKRIEHTKSKSCVIGISGGLDSTLALLVTAKAYDIIDKPHCDIIAVTMPGFGTTDRTYNNALRLMEDLGVTIREISIREACIQHFNDIEHDINKHDVTYENSQARERTQILMDIANQCSGIVVGTGDLSELALGWATYNGDHMSMYGVNASVPKTLIQHIVRWVAKNSSDTRRATLLDIVDTPISPELTPADEEGNIKQKTENLVGPYELHDFFLYNFVRYGFSPEKIYFMAQKAFEGSYDNETIKKWLTTFLRRFFTQQFKRSCMPDGAKTGSCNLSPQNSWIMPSDTNFTQWINECEKL